MIVDGYRQKGTPIQLEELKSFLWGAATRLRGQIDAAGYKEYIFPLLFFKRISDVYDEQYDGFLHDGGTEYANMQSQELAIRIPDGAHWKDVRQVTENVGQRLVEAFIAIEQANPGEETDGRIVGGLDGIFGPKDGWTNKAKMPDHIITGLIEDFSKYDLSLASCPADEMGQAYEYLVGKFADDAGNTAQEFYTNRTVVTLMAEILQPKPNESIYDPTCGSGGMLVKCLDYLRLKGQSWQGVKVFGQEINALTSAIARMNLYLNGVEDFSIVREDTLAHPAFVDGSHLRKFDMVLANPPYSIKTWNREAFINDKWGRNMWGAPIQARADYAFIQHIISSMDEKYGRSAILLPHGVLNRDEDKDIRIKHVKSDTIDTIIGLGRNLFYNSGLESFIFICSNCKPDNKKGKILFIEAEELTHKEGKQAYLYDDDINQILNAYHSPEDIPGFSKHASIEEILSNDGNLNIKSYVKTLDSKENVSISNALYALSQTQHRLCSAINALPFSQTHLIECDFNCEIECDSTNWKTVKLSDVAEEYSIRIENPSESEYGFYIGSDCIGQYDFKIHKKSDASTITSTQKGFKKGDYLLVRRSLYGSDFRERAPRAEFDGVCSADILTIREKPGIIADGFLIYVLYQKSLWDYIVSNSNGGLTRRIKWRQLADFKFKLPPLKVQIQLSERLWSAYRLKESYQNMLSSIDEMVKSQFIEMFGNPLSSIQKNELKKLGDCCQINPRRPSVSISDSDLVSFVPMPAVNEDGYIDGATNEEYGKVKKGFTYFENNDVLFAKITPCMENGKGAIAEALTNGIGMGSTEFHVLRPIDGISNPYWLLTLTRMPFFREYAAKNMSGTGGQRRVGAAFLENFMIGLPSISEQETFETIYRQADKSKFELKKSIEAIDKVIKSLINSI